MSFRHGHIDFRIEPQSANGDYKYLSIINEILAKLPSMAICKTETKNAIFRFLHLQRLNAVENGGSSLNRTALAVLQEPHN